MRNHMHTTVQTILLQLVHVEHTKEEKGQKKKGGGIQSQKKTKSKNKKPHKHTISILAHLNSPCSGSQVCASPVNGKAKSSAKKKKITHTHKHTHTHTHTHTHKIE